MGIDAAYRWHVAEERIFMMTAFEENLLLADGGDAVDHACMLVHRPRTTDKQAVLVVFAS